MKTTKYLKFILVVFMLFGGCCYGQRVPQDIQQILDSLKTQTNYRLQNCRNYYLDLNSYYGYWRITSRHNQDLREFSSIHRKLNNFPDRLNVYFQNTPLRSKADSSNLNIGMIYDNNMRNRIVQLLRNEFRKDELDTIIVRRFEHYQEPLRKKMFDLCQFDTIQRFKDSLDAYWDRRNFIHYKDYFKYDVMTFLHFDTLASYQKIFDSLYQEWEEQTRAEVKQTIQFNLRRIIEVSGNINDKRFIPELKNIYAQSSDERVKAEAERALVRMRVEPFRKNYFQERIKRIEYIKNNSPNRDLGNPIGDIAKNLQNQEAFKELSNYLLSDQIYKILEICAGITIFDTVSIAQEVYHNMGVFIGNTELQEMIKGEHFRGTPELYKKVYDWMQKNYGRYIFRRWY